MTAAGISWVSALISPIRAMVRSYVTHLRLFSREVRLFLLASLLFSLGYSFLSVLLNLRLSAVGISKVAIGDIQGANALGTVLMALPAAVLFDRMGMRALFVCATLVCTVGFGFVALGYDPQVLFVSMLIIGAASAVKSIVAGPFLMSYSKPKERVYAFGLSFGIECAAGIVGTFVAGYLPVWFENPWIGGYSAALLLGAALVGLAVIPYIALRGGGKKDRRPRKLRQYVFNKNTRFYLKVILPDAIIGLGAGIPIPFLNLYLADRFKLGTGAIGAALACTNGMMLVGILASPPLGRRFGLLKVIAGTQLLSVPFMVALAFTYDVRVAFTALIIRAGLMNMSHPLARAFQLECIEPDEQATVNSLAMLGWNGMWMLGTMLGGRVIERSGFTTSILMTSGIYFASMVIYLLFWWNPKYIRIGQERAVAEPVVQETPV